MNRLFVIAALLCSTNAYAQKGVVFTASTSQNSTYMDSSTGTLLPTLTSYKIQFTKGEATVKTVDIGKPTPDASNNITYLDSTLFYAGLQPSTSYMLTVLAVGPSGTSSSASVSVTTDPAAAPLPNPPGAPAPIPNDPNPAEIVLRVSGATTSGAWNPINDTTAAGGAALINPNLNASKLAAPPVPAQNYFDVTFTPQSGVAYHIWLRLRAANDSYQNDSVFLQFSSATDKTGSPLPKPGTSGAQVVSLEEGSSAGVSGWGWNDSNYGALAANVYFNAGTQTLRILQREDGVRIDQIVISSQKYVTARPGTTKNDATILPQ